MKKRILHLLASNKFSGAENVVCTIIENFCDKYEMAYCSPFGEIEKILKTKNVNYLGLKKFDKRRLKKIIKEYNPDIIHAHDYRASILAASSGFKGKIISHLHNNCPFAKSWNLKTILYNSTLKKYNKVIGVSDKVYSEAIYKDKIKGKYVTIYNYVDKETVIKKSNYFTHEKKYDLFFFGRLTEQKDPLKFIEIVNILAKKQNNILAVMIGDGDLRESCEQLIKKYRLEKNISILGFVENPFPIIKNCNIGMMPSKWEGFGLTAVESLILGKIILNSGVGGLGEIYINYPEFICYNAEDYALKFIKYKDIKFNCENIISDYIDLNGWKEKINKVYES